MTLGGVFALTAKEERGEQLSPGEQRIVDDYWQDQAVPLTPEFRERLIAAARRGMAERDRRIMEWRVLLFTIHWWLSGKEPDWHRYFACGRCHPWLSVPWTGPFDLGEQVTP